MDLDGLPIKNGWILMDLRWIFNSSPWFFDGPIFEIDGLPNLKMGGFSMAMLVITRW